MCYSINIHHFGKFLEKKGIHSSTVSTLKKHLRVEEGLVYRIEIDKHYIDGINLSYYTEMYCGKEES